MGDDALACDTATATLRKCEALEGRAPNFSGCVIPVLEVDRAVRQELIYVGMNKAKSMLIVVGSAQTCASLQ